MQDDSNRDLIAVPFKRAFGPTGLVQVGTAKGRQLIASNEVASFFDGNRRMVVVASLRAYVQRKLATRPALAIPPEVSERKSRAGKLGKAAQMAKRGA